MLTLFAVIIPILFTDIINPVLLAGVIYTLGSRKPYLNAVSILLGWFVVYFICGIGLAIGGFAELVGLKSDPQAAGCRNR